MLPAKLFQRKRLKYEKVNGWDDGRQVMAIPHMALWPGELKNDKKKGNNS